MSRVWDEADLSGGHLLVALALADFADDAGKCWPAISTLAKKARLSDRQVRRVLADMEKQGLLTRTERAGHSSIFRLTIGGGQNVTPDKLTPDAHDTPPLTPMSPITVKEPSIKQPKRAIAVPEDFSVDAEMVRWAGENVDLGIVSLAKETDAFIDYHRSKGNTFKDIKAAWRNWMRNAGRFNKKPTARKASNERNSDDALRQFAAGH